MLVTAPTIGRLLARPRLWAYRKVKRGDYGPVIHRRGRALLVNLANVEERIGRRFSSAHLAAIGLHTSPTEEEE
jgi:hypothetical protein